MRTSLAMRAITLVVGLVGSLVMPGLALAHGIAHAHGHEVSARASGPEVLKIGDASADDDGHQHPVIGAQLSSRLLDVRPPAPSRLSVELYGLPAIARPGVVWGYFDPVHRSDGDGPVRMRGPPKSI